MAGINIEGHWSNSYSNDPSIGSDAYPIADWAESTIHANWASIQITLWQNTPTSSDEIWESTDVQPNNCGTRTPIISDIENYIGYLKNEKKLNVALKIHLGVNDTDENGTCSATGASIIDPVNSSDWFVNYEAKVLEYARIAQNKNVDMFAFGNELAKISRKYESDWVDLISKIGEVYTKGSLVYCAILPNLSSVDDIDYEYRNVVFWNYVDFIGLNLWPSVSSLDTPSVDQIVQGYTEFKNKIDAWSISNGANKKIIFTEFGVPNREKCVENPQISDNGLGSNLEDNPENQECQKNAYEAFFQVFDDDPEIIGLFSHSDTVGHPPAGRDFYQIRGLQADQSVSAEYKELAESDGDGIPDYYDDYPFEPIANGDINNDNIVDLKDIILSLKIATVQDIGDSIFTQAESSGDGAIGIEEAIYIGKELLNQ